jgi:two-component system, chemotaxis family, sensor kinase CheA
MAHYVPDPPYVLVVDDDRSTRELLGDALYREGLVPLLVSSGEEAMDMMRGASVPVLIVLELGLRGMRSWQLLAKLKADERWARTPAVLISSRPEADVPRDMPIEAFLRKPIDLDLLLRAARQAILRE